MLLEQICLCLVLCVFFFTANSEFKNFPIFQELSVLWVKMFDDNDQSYLVW